MMLVCNTSIYIMRNDRNNPTEGDLEYFLTHDQEKLLLMTRKHWFVIFPSVWVAIILISFLTFGSFYFFTRFFSSLYLGLASIVFFISLLIFSLTKIVTDWYYHLYIVTSRKVLEVWYVPLFSHNVNDVLLDQVKCTEIDINMHGIINGLMDMGDVVITFDRPTHSDAFVFNNVPNARKIGAFLSRELIPLEQQESSARWFRSRNDARQLLYTEDIFQGNMKLV